MMQLLCNGVRVDLPADVKLQFKASNPIFAFDDLSCDRTTEFSLPTTPTNDQLFALARIPEYGGGGMMVQYAAELQFGTLVERGILYVQAFDGVYKAVLCTGQNTKILAAKGEKIADLCGDVTSPYGQPITRPAGYTLWQTLQYGNCSRTAQGGGTSEYYCENSLCRPCMSLYIVLINYLLQRHGITVNIPQDLRNYVYLPAKCVDYNGQDITTVGQQVYLRDNAPDWTTIETANILAYLGGYAINVEDGALSFTNDMSIFSGVIDITDKLTKIGSLQRTFGDWAKVNSVEWADADTFKLTNKAAKYFIQNANISDAATIYTIPGQPANSYGSNNYALLWDENSRNYFLPDRPIIPMGSEWFAEIELNQYSLRSYRFGSRQLPTNPIMEVVMEAATRLEVECRMSFEEYRAIRNTTYIDCRNCRYIWIERSWQNDICKFVLQRID